MNKEKIKLKLLKETVKKEKFLKNIIENLIMELLELGVNTNVIDDITDDKND